MSKVSAARRWGRVRLIMAAPIGAVMRPAPNTGSGTGRSVFGAGTAGPGRRERPPSGRRSVTRCCLPERSTAAVRRSTSWRQSQNRRAWWRWGSRVDAVGEQNAGGVEKGLPGNAELLAVEGNDELACSRAPWRLMAGRRMNGGGRWRPVRRGFSAWVTSLGGGRLARVCSWGYFKRCRTA